MKKIIILILSLTLASGVVGCSSKKLEKNINNSQLTEKTGQNGAESKEIEKSNGEAVPAFASKDLDGNDVTNEIFKDKKLTMINVWGTECPPCVAEMPDLQKLYEEIKEKEVNLIGIVVDGKQNIEQAKNIIEKKGVKYTNITLDEELQKFIQAKIQFTPTTIFVNEKGDVIGEMIIGAREKDEYKEIIENLLNEIK